MFYILLNSFGAEGFPDCQVESSTVIAESSYLEVGPVHKKVTIALLSSEINSSSYENVGFKQQHEVTFGQWPTSFYFPLR